MERLISIVDLILAEHAAKKAAKAQGAKAELKPDATPSGSFLRRVAPMR